MSSAPIEPSAVPAAPEPSGDFAQLTHYCGLDWARDAHEVAVVDKAGNPVLTLSFDDTAEGWALLREKLSAFTTVGVTIETSCGSVVERLLEMNLAVYPLNPKVAQRYRDRKSVAGAKCDALDALSFADALRTDGHGWRRLNPLDPATHEMRLLSRDEIALIQNRTALVNQLRAALHEYYPTALEAFDEWTAPAAWEFVVAFATPAILVAAGKRRWEKFMHSHKIYRPQTADKRLELFAKATQFASPNPAVTAAKSLLAVALCKQLLTLQAQLDQYRRRIEELFNSHPDRDLFGSLPGAGPKLAPRLLAEIGGDRNTFATVEGLQCYAGTAPVTRQSGRSRSVRARLACNKTLRATVHLWADLSRPYCTWAQAYYNEKKKTMGHAAALRCLGQRWLKILWKMWQERKPYDEPRHTRNQVTHGSWVIQLLPQTPAAQPS